MNGIFAIMGVIIFCLLITSPAWLLIGWCLGIKITGYSSDGFTMYYKPWKFQQMIANLPKLLMGIVCGIIILILVFGMFRYFYWSLNYLIG